MLTAGLKVAELIGLQAEEINSTVEIDGSLKVSMRRFDRGEGEATNKQPTLLPPHHVSAEGFRAVRARVDQTQKDDWLCQFIGVSKFRWQHPSRGERVSSGAQNILSCKPALEPTGWALRYTLAVEEMRAGSGHDEISEHLGLYDDYSILIYAEMAKERGVV